MKDKYKHTEAYYIIMTLIMYLVTFVLVGVTSFIKAKSIGNIIANIIISIIFITVVIFYLKKVRVNKEHFTKKLSNYGRIINIYWILFVFSFIITFIPSDIRPMFIIGIIMTLVSNEHLGVLFQIYLSVMMTMISTDSIEALFFYLVSGLVGCTVAKFFAKRETIFYAVVVMLTANLALTGALVYAKNAMIDIKFIISSLFCTLEGIAIIILILPYVYYRVNHRLRNKLLRITEPDFELIMMLQNYSKDLYEHSIKVAKLSERIAVQIGADSLLAKTGGYYHKIGKLEGKDYIKSGVEIARSYSFPEEVTDIIKQYTGRKESPKSVEAAIVMLSDTIVSAFEYLNNKQNGLVYDKDLVIDQIIETKLDKDMLDDSGLSVKMLRNIKKCLKQEENIYDI